jgi:asparagine synthase (glutamine-hydrolysing)
MCGIYGEIRTGGDVSPLALATATMSMQSRGPDAAGFFIQGPIGFGHRRLSILDLSAASQQPMMDNQLGLGIVFNGCIYNFKDLRTELSSKGYQFFSKGDTEVILKA